MHRIELHSVTVIGCAQNKAKYCTQLCTATAPHVPKFLKQFRFYFEYYEIFVCLHPHAQIAGLLQRRSQTLKLDVKLRNFGTAPRVNKVTE